MSGRVWDGLATAVLAWVAVYAGLTFRNYGLSWDDYAHSQYGELLFQYYASGLHDKRALSWVNLFYYGGGFDLLSAAAAKILPISVFETRRLIGAAIGLLGMLATWRAGRRVAGPLGGFVALALIAACPLYYGNMFMNPKDSPFAVAMAMLLLGQIRALDEYPRVSAATIVLVGVAFGLAFGSRIMGGFAALQALGAMALVVIVQTRRDGFSSAWSNLVQFVLRLLPAAGIAYLVMAFIWPWSVIDPLNPFHAVEYFSRFFEKPWPELFEGAIIPVNQMPRSYVTVLLATKLPEVFIVLAAGGAVGATVATFRGQLAVRRRAVFLLLLLAALLPIAVTIAIKPAMYNGLRHFLFILPPMAVLGGLAGSWLVDALRGIRLMPVVLAAAFAIGIMQPAIEMARLHPYEYTYFNWLYGGVREARDEYMLDYTGLSLKQASQRLLVRLTNRGETRPPGRRWKIAVCGPHRSPQVELGPDFETTWDPRGADFAMMLGEFYCRKLDAPLLVEIVRHRVAYARVYDIRGRSYDTLLTVPGL